MSNELSVNFKFTHAEPEHIATLKDLIDNDKNIYIEYCNEDDKQYKDHEYVCDDAELITVGAIIEVSPNELEVYGTVNHTLPYYQLEHLLHQGFKINCKWLDANNSTVGEYSDGFEGVYSFSSLEQLFDEVPSHLIDGFGLEALIS